MERLIGFATEFYTLWNMEKEPQYIECNGSYHLVGYNYRYSYLQNISKDLQATKSKYPTLDVDEELRGKTQSWMAQNKEDLCPQIMKFGKYYGKDLNELVELDFNYVLWVVENSYSSNQQYASSLSKVVDHFKAINNEKLVAENEREIILSEFSVLKSFTFIPERNLKLLSDNFASLSAEYRGLKIYFIFEYEFETLSYNGFEYGLPLINGKAKRIKGNNVTISFERLSTDKDDFYGDDSFLVKSISIKKI